MPRKVNLAHGVAVVVLVAVATLGTPSARVWAGSTSIDSLIAAMSTEEKVGQLFMVSFYGDEADETAAGAVRKNRATIGVANANELINRYHVGGIIYFTWTKQITSTKQVARLSNALQQTAAATAHSIPLLVATDQEGGAVARLQPPAPRFPGNMALGASRRTDLARAVAKAMGEELRAVGINENIAPVADVNVNPANPVIGVRSFSSNATLAADMTAAMVRGYQDDARIAASAKHFPGHGDTNINSHSGLPVINHTRAQWDAIDAPPFEAGIAAGLDAIMTGHIAVPALDATNTPATLSEPILTGILRDELGFDGVIVTDSLRMGALRKTYTDQQIPGMAIQAGVDVLLNPFNLPLAYNAVLDAVGAGTITGARLDASVRRILELKQKLGLFDSAQVSVKAAGQIVGSSAHRAVERDAARASVTLAANDNGVLPLRPAVGDRILLVGPVQTPLDILAATFAKRGVATERLVTGYTPSASVINNARNRALANDYVVALTDNADKYAQQRDLVAALSGTSTPVITASTGEPYDIAYYNSDAKLCLYTKSDGMMRALASVLLGDVNPAAKLPVTIPSAADPEAALYDFGHGLTYP